MTKSKVSIADLFREHLPLPNRECIASIRQLKSGNLESRKDSFDISCSGYATRSDGEYCVTRKGERTLDAFDRYKKQNILVRAFITVACAVYILHPTLLVVYALILGFISLFFGAAFSVASLVCLLAYYIFERDG